MSAVVDTTPDTTPNTLPATVDGAAARREQLPDAARVHTIEQAVKLFYRFPSPWILTALTLGFLAARIAFGAWSHWDAVILAALIAWQPFQEWLIHVYLLHWRPRRFLGRTLDPRIAARHRAHHEDPSDLPIVFMPIDAMLTSIVVQTALLGWLMPTWQLALTALFVASAIGLVYEWTHFLIHTSYRPRGAFYRRIWRYHRLHHFKNEHYWFGVTMHQGDRVLGTLPDHREVETSPTARNLGLSLGAGTTRAGA
jgi:hypothetical protein